MAWRRGGAAGRRAGRKGPVLSFRTKLEARSRSNLYFALVFLDRERRDAFRDVYRFARAADDVADGPGSPAEVREELSAWRRELDLVYAGRASHPISQRLARVVSRYRLPRAPFDDLLGALESDVRGDSVEDTGALLAYSEAVAASLAQLCLHILGVFGDAAERYARDVGVALQIANILRDLREDARAGRVYLPAEELRRAGASREDVLAGRMTPGVTAVCRDLAALARRLIGDARADLDPELRRQLAVPEIWADVYLALLRELEAVDFDVFGHRPYLRRRRKVVLAVRRWLRAQAGAELVSRSAVM